MTTPLKGKVENGRRTTVDLPFYSGPVGVRVRGDTLELAWFGRPPSATPPLTGTLDGVPIEVTAIRSRDLTADVAARQPASADRAIVVTAVLGEPLGAPGD